MNSMLITIDSIKYNHAFAAERKQSRPLKSDVMQGKFWGTMINDKNVTFSTFKGLGFRFKIDNKVIEYKGSSFSGREEILIDGNLISESRSFRKESKHNFELDGEKYTLTLKADSLTKGPIRCSLLKSHNLIKKYIIKIQPKAGIARKYIPTIGGILFGLGLVFFKEHFVAILILFLIFIGSLRYVFKPVIKYEEVHNKAHAADGMGVRGNP